MNNHNLKLKIEKFRDGDMDAFSEIYEELKIPVYTIIYRILYDRMLAEDVMQDIFVRLYKAPPSLQIDKPRAYIFQMARNLALDSKRKIKVSEPLADRGEPNNPSMEFLVSTRLDIESALKNLELEDREIVTMRINANMKFREIAELTKKPLGTVLWRYQRAIGRLREILSGGES